jgi:nucleotide-binding universal stress UspA family protein
MTQSIPSKYRIIAALDFSALGDRALEEAIRLSRTHEHAELHVIVVGWLEGEQIRLPGPKGLLLLPAKAVEAMGEHVQANIARLERAGQTIGLERIALYATDGAPAERICALAATIDADLVVLGTHGREGLQRWILGSVAEEVVRRASCGVLVVRPRDFLDGQQLPRIEPPLKPGEHALKPFHHAPTYHYVVRGSSSTGRVMPIG